MKVKFIEMIKQILKKLKIRTLPDEELEEQVNQMLENDEEESIGLYMKSFGNRLNQKEVAKSVMEAENISTEAKKDVIDTLPHSTKKELFKQSIKTKEIIAQKDKETFLKIILTDKNLNPYNELYYRLDKAFSDSQLQIILDKIYEKRQEDYDVEKVLAIVGKQIAVDTKTYGSFLPSHLDEITRTIKIDNKDFDILDSEHRIKLLEATGEESRILRETYLEKFKNRQLSEKEKIELVRLNFDNINAQFDNMVAFAEKRKEELIKQGTEFIR